MYWKWKTIPVYWGFSQECEEWEKKGWHFVGFRQKNVDPFPFTSSGPWKWNFPLSAGEVPVQNVSQHDGDWKELFSSTTLLHRAFTWRP